MTDRIETGTILIDEAALLPASLRFESEPYSDGWRTLKNLDSHGLDQKINEVGWSFFYLAGAIRASVLGFDRDKALHRAVRRVLAALNPDKFNCVEITQVTARRFMGLPCVTVSAHWRHIQEGMFLFHADRTGLN